MSSTITPQVLPVPSATEILGSSPERTAIRSVAAHEYRPHVDGLRAIAVMGVILYHAFPRRMAGGFIGVDVFFVISGYLITTIILSNLERGKFSIADFYGKRIRRIFPALLLVLLFCASAGWLVLLRDEYRQLGKHIVGGTSFVQNFVLWGESGYFDSGHEAKPLLHLWSLAVEEQYYIFWPLLLSYAWMHRWRFTVMNGAIIAVSFGVSVWLAWRDPVAAFYSPLSRFWELMVGGSLAYIALHRSDLIARNGNLLCALGVGLLLSGFLLTNHERAFPGFWALLPTMGTFLVIAAGSGAWINRTLLSSRPFVTCGLISYPLYLWHWPLLSFAHIVWPENGHLTKIAVVLLSIVLAWLTHRFVERKIRWHRSANRTALLLALGLVLMLLGGVAINDALITPRFDSVNLATRTGWEFLASRTPDGQARDGIYPLHEDRKSTTLFLGDSHVAQYAERIYDDEEHNASRNGAIFAVAAACPPIPHVFKHDLPVDSECGSVRREALAKAANSRITTVVIGGYWSYYFNPVGYYVVSGQKELSLTTLEGRAAAFAELDREIRELQAQHKTVYVLLDNPIGDPFDPHVFLARIGRFDPRQAEQRVKIDGLQQSVRKELIALAERDHASVIDPDARLCVDEACIRLTGKSALYVDRSHLNPDWLVKHADYIDPSI
ncbi:acyltransferase family protein [Paraburkholderia flagellata]|uniref:acyltransferase family protein n=1 Tax=Paraburkholderia flagellata TaxID=2883241 RepID=UPI001F42B949|nr:acyltransferase family protein [Paraburkholderia flagellata]